MKQVERHPARHKRVSGGRRIRKTEFGMMWLLKRILTSPYRGEGWYTAPTFRWAKRIVWNRLNEFLEKQPVKVKVGENATDLIIRLVDNKFIVLVGMDKYDSLRGGGPIAVLNDEKPYSHPKGFREVIDLAISDKRSPTLDLGTPRGRNHWYQDWLEGDGPDRDPETMSWQFKTADIGTVPPEELARYQPGGIRAMTKDLYQQEWEGEFLGYVGLLFPEFVNRDWPSGNIISPGEFHAIAHKCWHFGSIDWGFADEAVLHWWAKTPENGLILYGEVVISNRTPRAFVQYAKMHRRLPQIAFGDPSIFNKPQDGGTSVGDQLIQAGLRVTRADNRFQPSITHLRTLCELRDVDVFPRLAIVAGRAPRAVNNLCLLQTEDVSDTGGGFKKDVDCHAADSMRYGAMTIYTGEHDNGPQEIVPAAHGIPPSKRNKSFGLDMDEPQYDSDTGWPID